MRKRQPVDQHALDMASRLVWAGMSQSEAAREMRVPQNRISERLLREGLRIGQGSDRSEAATAVRTHVWCSRKVDLFAGQRDRRHKLLMLLASGEATTREIRERMPGYTCHELRGDLDKLSRMGAIESSRQGRNSVWQLRYRQDGA